MKCNTQKRNEVYAQYFFAPEVNMKPYTRKAKVKHEVNVQPFNLYW